MISIEVHAEQSGIDKEALISAIMELGSNRERAEELAADIIDGYGFAMRVQTKEKANQIIKLFGDAGVRIKTVDEAKNS